MKVLCRPRRGSDVLSKLLDDLKVWLLCTTEGEGRFGSNIKGEKLLTFGRKPSLCHLHGLNYLICDMYSGLGLIATFSHTLPQREPDTLGLRPWPADPCNSRIFAHDRQRPQSIYLGF